MSESFDRKSDPTVSISDLADIENSVRGSRFAVGSNSMIDAFVKIKFSGGSGDIVIGRYCYINAGCVLYSGNGITLGNNVLVAANCTFAPTNHAFADRDMPIRLQGFQASRGGIVVEDDVWIGANCVILDGAHIGQGCVIAAGSVVRGRLDPFGVYGGSPLTRLSERGA